MSQFIKCTDSEALVSCKQTPKWAGAALVAHIMLDKGKKM